jgi:hypothetical protein
MLEVSLKVGLLEVGHKIETWELYPELDPHEVEHMIET